MRIFSLRFMIFGEIMMREGNNRDTYRIHGGKGKRGTILGFNGLE